MRQHNNAAAVGPTVGLGTGAVKVREGDRFWVDRDGEAIGARRAAGCLLTPEINDRVLVYDDGGEAYILSVLERGGEGPASMDFDHGLSIRNREGAVSLTSPGVRVTAETGELAVDGLSVRGDDLQSDWRAVRQRVRFLDTAAERWIQKIARSYRTVSEFEETRAGRLRCIVSDLFSVSAKNVAVTAEKTAKTVAKKILLG